MDATRTDQTAMLAEYAVQLRYEDIPPAAIDHAKRILLNIAAAALWGGQTGGGRQVQAVFEAMGGVRRGPPRGAADDLGLGHAAHRLGHGVRDDVR
jgi:2-methylcitrate dehydratase PrpD